MRPLILASSFLFLVLGGVASAKEIKYFQCIYEDGSEDWYLYAYDKKHFYTFEKTTFKESKRYKIEKEVGDTLFAPVFYKNDKENILLKHSEYRFNKTKENLYIQYYPQKNNDSKKRDNHSLKCREVKPIK